MALFKMTKKSAFGGDDKYSRSISIPQYEPKNQKPFIQELYDKRKYSRLVKDANDAYAAGKITSEEMAFLKFAAARHIVFRYDKIADYYAHANADMQKLMEDSALVIVDLEDAIMNGFVETTARIDEIIQNHSKRSKDEIQ
jgi:hypothetical protein